MTSPVSSEGIVHDVVPNPAFTVVDKRAEKAEAQRIAKAGQAEWAKNAAATLWWEAQGAEAGGRTDLTDVILDKRAELLDGARGHLGPVGKGVLGGLTADKPAPRPTAEEILAEQEAELEATPEDFYVMRSSGGN